MSSQSQRPEDLFLVHYDFVRRTAFCFAPLPDLVDDVIQESFHRFVRQADRYDLTKDLRPLLKTITKNVAFDFWEKRQAERSKIGRLVMEHVRQFGMEQAVTTEECGKNAGQDELQALEACLGKLSERGKKAIQLHYYQKKKLSEIAESFQATPEGVRQLIYRLRQKLRSCIDRTLENIRKV